MSTWGFAMKQSVSYSPNLVLAKFFCIRLVTKQTDSSRMCLSSEDEMDENVPALPPPKKKSIRKLLPTGLSETSSPGLLQ